MTVSFAPPPQTETPDRILVVDDQEDNRLILQRRLSRLGYVVETASSGDEALARIGEDVPDLVLLDYMMPGKTGMEVLSHLRLTHDRAVLPIIMVTARSEDQDIVDCIVAGANDYIPKPISFPVLHARVEAQLERRAATLAIQEANAELEERVAERTKDLIAHNTALRDAHATLERADRARSLFLATISHEMRTPLNAIIGLSELLRCELHGALGAPDYRAYVGEIRKSGGYLLELVNNIIDSVDVSQGPNQAEQAEIDVIEVLTEAISISDAIDPEAPSRIRFDGNGARHMVLGDKSRLRQAFRNIIDNALKFSPPEQMVVIRQKAGGGKLTLDFCDRGPGIPSDQLDEIFAPFIQLYNASEAKKNGVGLGLTIARDILRSHGGSITIHNREGGGTTVEVMLSLCEQAPTDC